MRMKTYVLTLSEVFPKSHVRAGEPTGFRENIFKTKIHTIRANFDFWRKRFEKIERGEAELAIRQWVGKPYGKGSTQRELFRLTREDGIGIQKLKLSSDALDGNSLNCFKANGKTLYLLETLANNDGLTIDDWREWFKGYNLTNPLVIIHFTKFRY